MDANHPLIRHLRTTTTLPVDQLLRLVADVLAYHNQTFAEFARRRHTELVQQGLKNAAIFEQIASEAANRPFAIDPPSPRQVRRLIYG